MKMKIRSLTHGVIHLLLLLPVVLYAEDYPVRSQERGAWRHTVASSFQSKPTIVEVLQPDTFDRTKRYRVIYLLPVEPSEEVKFGDPIQVVRKFGYHNKHDVIFVRPTFSKTPWYGNHDTDQSKRQEDYLISDVIPLVERNYPTLAAPEGRLLLGFSKSGWGALLLILRNPGVFGYAASWDAPLMMTEKQFGSWQTDEVFGTPQNMAHYLPSRLVESRSEPFRTRTRVVVAGSNLFGRFSDKRYPYDGQAHTEAFHSTAEAAGMLHVYAPALKADHAWLDQWMRPVIEMLMELTQKEQSP
jgi:hypothetical protein